MARHVVAERYARALFEVSETHGLSEAFLADLRTLEQMLQDYPDLPRVLANPLIASDAKANLLGELLPQAHPMLKNFLRLVIEHRRQRAFVGIIEAFRIRFNAARRRVDAHAIVATALDAETHALLQQQLSRYLAHDVQLDARVDPDILGGVIIQYGDHLIDGSVRGRLRALAVSLN